MMKCSKLCNAPHSHLFLWPPRRRLPKCYQNRRQSEISRKSSVSKHLNGQFSSTMEYRNDILVFQNLYIIIQHNSLGKDRDVPISNVSSPTKFGYLSKHIVYICVIFNFLRTYSIYPFWKNIFVCKTLDNIYFVAIQYNMVLFCCQARRAGQLHAPRGYDTGQTPPGTDQDPW